MQLRTVYKMSRSVSRHKDSEIKEVLLYTVFFLFFFYLTGKPMNRDGTQADQYYPLTKRMEQHGSLVITSTSIAVFIPY